MRPKNTYRLDDSDLLPANNIDEIFKQIVERLPESEQKSLEPLITRLLQLINRRDIDSGKHGVKKFESCISILEDAVDNLDNSSSGWAIQLIDALPSEVVCDEFLLIVLYECAGDLEKFLSWFSRSQFDYDLTKPRYLTVESGYARNLIYVMQGTYRKTSEPHKRVLNQMIDVFFVLLTSDLRRRLDQCHTPHSRYLSIDFFLEVGHHPVFEDIINELTKLINETRESNETQKSNDGPNVDVLLNEVSSLITTADDADWKSKSLNLPVQEPDNTYATYGEYFKAQQDVLHKNIEVTKCTADALELAKSKALLFDDYQLALAKVLDVRYANIIDDSLINLAVSEAQTADGYSLTYGRLGILGTVWYLDVLNKELEGKHLPVDKKTTVLPNSTSVASYFDNLITHVFESLSDSGEKFRALWFIRQVKLTLKKPLKDINDIFDGKDKISLDSLFSGVELSQGDWLNASTLVTADILKAINRWDTGINSLIEAIVEDMPLAHETDAALYKQVLLHAFDENSFPHFYHSGWNEDECEVEYQEMKIMDQLNRFADCVNETLTSFIGDKNSVLRMNLVVNQNISENHPLIRLLRALAEYVYPDNPNGVLEAAEPWSGLIDEQIPYIVSGYDSNKHPIVKKLIDAELVAAR